MTVASARLAAAGLRVPLRRGRGAGAGQPGGARRPPGLPETSGRQRAAAGARRLPDQRRQLPEGGQGPGALPGAGAAGKGGEGGTRRLLRRGQTEPAPLDGLRVSRLWTGAPRGRGGGGSPPSAASPGAVKGWGAAAAAAASDRPCLGLRGRRKAGGSTGKGRDTTARRRGKSSPRVPPQPRLPPAGVSGAGDPVAQPPAALQPVPPEVHAGGRAGSRGGERPEVSFAARASWCSARPAAASQLNVCCRSLLPLALAQSACRSARRQKGRWSHLWGGTLVERLKSRH